MSERTSSALEIQSTAERRPFTEERLIELLALARQARRQALAPHRPDIDRD